MYTEPDKFKKMRQEYGGIGSDALQLKRHQEKLALAREAKDTTIEGFNALMKYMDGKTTKTEVVNQLKSISTPDVDKVVQAVLKLDKTVLTKEDLKDVESSLAKAVRELSLIPKTHARYEQKETVKVSNLSEIKHDNSDIIKAIEKLDVRPVVDVKAPIVNVEKTDTKPLEDLTRDVLKATQANKPLQPEKFPEIPKTDLTKVEKKLDESNKHLKVISEKRFGGGGSGGHSTPYLNSEAKASYVNLESDGSVPVTIKNADPIEITGTVSSTAPEGGATEEVQDVQTSVLNQILSAISAISATRGIASDLRVTLLGGTTAVTGSLTSAGTVSTVTTVTTVATVSNQTNIGGLPATTMLPSISNTTAVLSNINNIVR